MHRQLFDVTSGVNGSCEADRQYLCHCEKGYDGPTGLGTPDGTAAFTDHGRHRVTLTDPPACHNGQMMIGFGEINFAYKP